MTLLWDPSKRFKFEMTLLCSLGGSFVFEMTLLCNPGGRWCFEMETLSCNDFIVIWMEVSYLKFT